MARDGFERRCYSLGGIEETNQVSCDRPSLTIGDGFRDHIERFSLIHDPRQIDLVPVYGAHVFVRHFESSKSSQVTEVTGYRYGFNIRMNR
jgi:hypothetical protein